MRLLRAKGLVSHSLSTRWKATCLQWPLNEQKDRFVPRIREVEAHWKGAVEMRRAQTNRDRGEEQKYILSMFPYPSGNLHMGHMRVYTISDVLARYYRLTGCDVIHPCGWDAFGLPAENAARERGVDAREWTYSNISTMRDQLLRTGVQFDWERELFTCDPKYYKWTQWIFAKLYEKKLVKRCFSEVNWDPVDNTVLAAEQIDNEGRSWRSGAMAEKKMLRQWMVETPKYAKRLSDGLLRLAPQWEDVAAIQSHWIGTCDVYRFLFPLMNKDGATREENIDLRLAEPTDIGEAAFIAINQEHALADKSKKGAEDAYVLPYTVLNGVTGCQLPLVVLPDRLFSLAPHVLGVRLSHSQADREWATSMGLPLKPPRKTMTMNLNDVTEIAQFGDFGGYLTSRKLCDWVVSRQRKWGTPIPMILSSDGLSSHPLPLSQLPLLQGVNKGTEVACSSLPGGVGYIETDTLDTFFDSAWYYLRYLDPHNDEKLVDFEKAKRAMPVHVYVGGIEHAAVHMFFARFICHFLYDIGVSPVEEPFRDLVPQGIVRGRTFTLKTGEYVKNEEVDEEGPKPIYRKTGEEVNVLYEKMSKSKHNGVDPLKVLERDGVDLSRLQLLSTSAPRAVINWGDADIRGLTNWMERLAVLVNRYVVARKEAMEKVAESVQATPTSKAETEIKETYNYFVRTISTLLDVLQTHSTAIARLMGMTNALRKLDPAYLDHSVEAERTLRALIVMLQVFAPHSASELWWAMQSVESINKLSTPEIDEQQWPEVDSDAQIDYSLKVNGKSCGRVSVPRQEIESLSGEEALEKSIQTEHAVFLRLLKEKGHTVHRVTVDKKSGLFYNLLAEIVPPISEEAVGKLLDGVQAERLREEREKREKMGETRKKKKEKKERKVKEAV